MANNNDEILRGVASILTEASAALARLGMQATSTTVAPGTKSAPQTAGASLADAAAALAQVATQFSGTGRPAAAAAPAEITASENYSAAHRALESGTETFSNGDYPVPVGDGIDASMSTVDFCTLHQLEPWVGEALDLLTPDQRAAVMDPPMNTCHARNLNGIVVSRIKQAVPLDQRLGIFVQINGLSDGVVDRISTLTPDQAESVMESGLKIQKAANPSGVAMRRITDVLRVGRQSVPSHGSFPTVVTSLPASNNRDGGAGARERSRTPAGAAAAGQLTSISETPDDVQNLMNTLGLEWWCGEVLKRLSLWQRQQVMKDVQNMSSVRNPSGVVMSRVRQFCEVSELMSIFIDINQFDSTVQQQLWGLTQEQQMAVINPGIFLQNVRNPSTAVRSRIKNVLAGNDAFGKPL